jgi:hypothetical protein
MWERASARMLPITSKAADHAPMATACCNACRTCATTNAFAMVTAFGAGIAVAAARFARRFARP